MAAASDLVEASLLPSLIPSELVTGSGDKGASRYDVRIKGEGVYGKADAVWEVA